MHTAQIATILGLLAISATAAPVLDDDVDTQTTNARPQSKQPGWADMHHPQWMHPASGGPEPPKMPAMTDAFSPAATTVDPRPWCKFNPHAPACIRRPKQFEWMTQEPSRPKPSNMPTMADTHSPVATTVDPRPWCKFNPHAPACIRRPKQFEWMTSELSSPEPSKTATPKDVQPSAAEVGPEIAPQEGSEAPETEIAPEHIRAWCEYHPHYPVCFPHLKNTQRDLAPAPTQAWPHHPGSPIPVRSVATPTTFQTSLKPSSEAQVETLTLCPTLMRSCGTYTITKPTPTPISSMNDAELCEHGITVYCSYANPTQV